MPTAKRVDPFINSNFLVEIDGITQAGFSECSGFDQSTDPIEYREGGENTTVRKLPGLTKYGNIVLKWGLTDSSELYDWYRDVVQGKIQRKNGSIVVLGLDGTEKVRWNFFNAWPTKYDPGAMDAKANAILINGIELANEGVELAKV